MIATVHSDIKCENFKSYSLMGVQTTVQFVEKSRSVGKNLFGDLGKNVMSTTHTTKKNLFQITKLYF